MTGSSDAAPAHFCISPLLVNITALISLSIVGACRHYVSQVVAMEKKAREIGMGGQLYYLFPSGLFVCCDSSAVLL